VLLWHDEPAVLLNALSVHHYKPTDYSFILRGSGEAVIEQSGWTVDRVLRHWSDSGQAVDRQWMDSGWAVDRQWIVNRH
jgi:hypothetical protein